MVVVDFLFKSLHNSIASFAINYCIRVVTSFMHNQKYPYKLLSQIRVKENKIRYTGACISGYKSTCRCTVIKKRKHIYASAFIMHSFIQLVKTCPINTVERYKRWGSCTTWRIGWKQRNICTSGTLQIPRNKISLNILKQ